MLLRPGYVTKEQMEACPRREVLVSPGHSRKAQGRRSCTFARYGSAKHYAPKAQVTILHGSFDKYKTFVKERTTPVSGHSALTARGPSWACRSLSTAKTTTA